MPFSDPIRDRRVQPQSLAFNDGATARGGASATYQSNIKATIEAAEADPSAYRREDVQAGQRALVRIAESEQRGKLHTAQYGRVCQWQIGGTISMMLGVPDNVPFQSEVYRCQGAYYRSNDGEWWHHVGRDDAGVWWYYAHIVINIPTLASATEARMAFYVNGVIVRVIDQLDAEMAGESVSLGTNPLRDVVLRGGMHLNLAAGDRFEVVLDVTIPGVPGSQSFGYPTSVGGYVTGHRVRCEQSPVAATADMNSYTFV